MDFIKGAESVYVSRVPDIYLHDPSRNDFHAVTPRKMSKEAKDELVAILSDTANYYRQPYGLTGSGWLHIEFRKAKEILVLEFGRELLDGSFRGRRIYGMLEDQGFFAFHQWKQKYVQHEMEDFLRREK